MNIYFDTEDNSKELISEGRSGFDKKVTLIAALTDGEERFLGIKVTDFLCWLKTYGEVSVWAHNLQYDLGNLFPKALDSLDITMVGGRLIKARWGKVTFYDSFNLWPMSLKKVGEAFNLIKLEFNADDPEYVFRDCEILKRAIQFVKNHVEQVIGEEKIPATLGGLCIKTWEALGGENYPETGEMSKAAFFGGRVEIFKAGLVEGPLTHVDINSLYPWAMTEKFPCEPREQKDVCNYGVSDVTIQVPAQAWCPLPKRLDDGRVVYCHGKIRGVWTNAEIRQAECMFGAKILKFHDGWGSRDGEFYYREFVHACYIKRLSARNPAENLFWKLLMNNLYGRLCISGVISRSVKLREENKDDGVPYGKKVLVKYEMPIPETANYLHAAHVTGLGRMLLGRFARCLKPEQLVYCDTDSLIFTGKSPFEYGPGIGQLKLEGVYGSGCVYAPKSYRFDDKYKAKGVPSRFAKEFLENQEATYALPFRMRESIAFFDHTIKEPTSKQARVLSVWRKITKRFSAVYDRKKLVGSKFIPYNINYFGN